MARGDGRRGSHALGAALIVALASPALAGCKSDPAPGPAPAASSSSGVLDQIRERQRKRLEEKMHDAGTPASP